jgi:Rrf2 family protein
MHISAKADYAVRAAAELAAAGDGLVKGEAIASAQGIPQKYLEAILNDMRRGGLVYSQRGAEGGYWLSRPANEITVADVIRVVDGPLAWVRGQRPEHVSYEGPAEGLRDVWIAVRANLRAVLERVTLADLAAGRLPTEIEKIVADPEAWKIPEPTVAGPRSRPRTRPNGDGQ